MLILPRDKRVEELEQRLKSMEELLRRAVPQPPTKLDNGASVPNTLTGAPSPRSDHSETATAQFPSSYTSEGPFSSAGEASQPSESGSPSLDGKITFAMASRADRLQADLLQSPMIQEVIHLKVRQQAPKGTGVGLYNLFQPMIDYLIS
jgi:hypothetical protein